MKNRLYEIICFVTAFLLPNAFLFFLYNNNRSLGDIRFHHTIALSIILSIISISLFTLFLCLARRYVGALMGLLLFWVSFWLFEGMFSIVHELTIAITRMMLLFGLMCGVGLILWCARKRIVPLHKNSRTMTHVLAFITCVLYGINFAPGLFLQMGIITDENQLPFNIRRSFVVDETLPSPDIFWFLPDGMLGFYAVEHYFDDTQDNLVYELECRGFIVNRMAEVHGANTHTALPILFSPTLYDDYYGALLKDIELNANDQTRVMEITQTLQRDGIDLHRHISPNFELFHAFNYIGYSIAGFRFNDNSIQELFELLKITTPLSLVNPIITRFGNFDNRTNRHDNNESIMAFMIEALSLPSPRLVYIHSLFTHSGANLVNVHSDSTFPVFDVYMPLHDYSANMLINKIDFILAQNPNAVIIIQADHGIHASGNKYLLERGFPEEKVIALLHSTFNAVRIPPQYGGGGQFDEPLDPRDITRVLVNLFVGPNYELLPRE